MFFAAFILIEFHTDYLAVALAGIVMLIAAYFLVDKIESDIYKQYDIQRQEMNEQFDHNYTKLQQLEDSILQASLQGRSNPKEKMTQLLEDMNQIENLASYQKENIELIKDGFKAIIQYSKENARQVALNTNENSERLLSELEKQIGELKKQIPSMVETNLQGIQNKFDSLSDAYLENTSLVSQRLEEIEATTQQISKALKQK